MSASLLPLPDDWIPDDFVHQFELNLLSYNVDTLCQITQGKPAASGLTAKPACKVVLSGGVPIPSGAGGTTQIVSWGAATIDTDAMFDPATNDHLTVKTPGWYRLVAGASWESAAGASERVVQILVNGTGDPTNVTDSENVVLGGATELRHQCMAYEHLDAGASIFVGVWQDTGGDVQLRKSGNYGTWLSAIWDAPY